MPTIAARVKLMVPYKSLGFAGFVKVPSGESCWQKYIYIYIYIYMYMHTWHELTGLERLCWGIIYIFFSQKYAKCNTSQYFSFSMQSGEIKSASWWWNPDSETGLSPWFSFLVVSISNTTYLLTRLVSEYLWVLALVFDWIKWFGNSRVLQRRFPKPALVPILWYVSIRRIYMIWKWFQLYSAIHSHQKSPVWTGLNRYLVLT